MSSRRQAREFALQALYHADIGGGTARQALDALWAGLLEGEGLEGMRPGDAEAQTFAESLALGADAARERIDALLEEVSTNWRVRRMPAVDRNILRVAVHELMASPDVPASVVINEAIEIAKRFGTSDSSAFVNGVLDRVARQLGRADDGGGRRRGRRPA